MPMARDMQIMINIELSYMLLVRQVLREHNISASSYARKLILRDLQARGLLTAEILIDVATTDSIEEMQDSILDKIMAGEGPPNAQGQS